MIRVEGLTKWYGATRAVEKVSFSVSAGEVLGFLGPNAAGKTTTLRILTGFHPPTEGKAVVAGYDVSTHPLEVKRRVGYLPESVPLYREMRVREYLAFVAAAKEVPRRAIPSQVGGVVADCGLQEVGGWVIGRLSRGFQQRVGLAQALLSDPQVLILDEPTVGLDPKQIIEIRRLIKAMAGRRTVLLSTHILSEVQMTCDRVVIINRGRVVAQDTPENLVRQLRGASQIELHVGVPAAEALPVVGAVEGVERVVHNGTSPDGHTVLHVESARERDLRSHLARVLVGRGWPLYELRLRPMTLEEVFVELVTQEEA